MKHNCGIQDSLGLKGMIQFKRGNYDEALALLKERELICIKLKMPEPQVVTLLLKATTIFFEMMRPDEALTLAKQARDLADEYGLIARVKEAEKLIQSFQSVLHEIVSKAGIELPPNCEDECMLAIIFDRHAEELYMQGNLIESLLLLKREENLYKKIDDKEGLLSTLKHQVQVLKDLGQSDKALSILEKIEMISQDCGLKEHLADAFTSHASTLHARGEFTKAKEILIEQERLWRELNNWPELQRTLGNLALTLMNLGDSDSALSLWSEQEKLCRELGIQNGLASALSSRANIFTQKGLFETAMELHEKSLQIYRDIEEPEGIVMCLINQASIIVIHSKHPEEALPIAKEAFQVAEKHGLSDLAVRANDVLNIIDSEEKNSCCKFSRDDLVLFPYSKSHIQDNLLK